LINLRKITEINRKMKTLVVAVIFALCFSGVISVDEPGCGTIGEGFCKAG
jgi:hypothetical protein